MQDLFSTHSFPSLELPGNMNSALAVRDRVDRATDQARNGPTIADLQELTAMTCDEGPCKEMTNMLSSALAIEVKSCKGYLKTLMLIHYLVHEGSDSFAKYFHSNLATIEPLCTYPTTSACSKDCALSVRDRARALRRLLANKEVLSMARDGASFVLQVQRHGGLIFTSCHRDHSATGGAGWDYSYKAEAFIQTHGLDVSDVTARIDEMTQRPVKSGGFADIYQGTLAGEHGNVKVAVKAVRLRGSGSTDSQRLQQKQLREISIWCSLQHPNLLPLYGLRFDENLSPAMVSPWCSHGDILHYLKCRQPLPDLDGVKLKLLEQVVDGLRYLHEHRPLIVHGDIKGANILISADDTASICDFGLASMHGECSGLTSLHSQSAADGTVRWMAPELFSDDYPRRTTQSDIWAYGCLVYEVQSGKMPYYNKPNDGAVVLALTQGQPPDRPQSVPNPVWQLMLGTWGTADERPDAMTVLRQLACLRRTYADDPRRWRELSSNTVMTNHLQEAAQRHVRAWLSKSGMVPAETVLQAVHTLLTPGHEFMFEPDLAARLLRPAFQLCIAEAVNRMDDPVSTAAHALVRYARSMLASSALESPVIRVRQALAHPCRIPSHEVRPLAKLLAKSDHAHADWVMRWIASPFVGELPDCRKHQEWVKRRLAFHSIGPGETSGRRKNAISIRAMAQSPDGARTFVGSLLGLCCWSMDDACGNPEAVWMHDMDALSLAISPDGQHIAIGSRDGKVYVLTTTAGDVVASWQAHPRSVLSVAFSPDGQHVLSGSSDSTLRIWNTRTGHPFSIPLRGHDGAVLSVAYTGDGDRVVSVSRDGTRRTWGVSTGEQIGDAVRIPSAVEGIGALSLSRAGTVLGCPDGRVAILDDTMRVSCFVSGESSLNNVPDTNGLGKAVSHVAWSPACDRVASASRDAGTIRISEAASGRMVAEPWHVEGEITCVAFSADGRRVAVGFADGHTTFWDATDDWLRYDMTS